MELFTRDEFSAKRRARQDEAIGFLLPSVRSALQDWPADNWDEPILRAAETLFNEILAEDSGDENLHDPAAWRRLREQIEEGLLAQTKPTAATARTIATWVSTAAINRAAMSAAQADEADLVMVWTTMHDKAVRPEHKEADGQKQPLGEKFDVAGVKMSFPGDPTAPIDLWINCRCMLRPDLMSAPFQNETVFAISEKPWNGSASRFDDDQWKRSCILDTGEGEGKSRYKLPIKEPNGDLSRAGVHAAASRIGQVQAPASAVSAAKGRLRSAYKQLGEDPPESLAGEVEVWHDELADATLGDSMSEETPLGPEPTAIPFHSVLAPEGVNSGDGRRFKEGALTFRPLPLPLTWQKTSAGGHDGNVTIGRIDQIVRVGNEMHATGVFLATPEADELLGLLTDFGQFGVSIDADSSTFDMLEDEEVVEFTSSRICAACVVAIPAFAEAWVRIGDAPEEFMTGDEVAVDDSEPSEALVAAATAVGDADLFKDLAPGKTEDGPGWLTHPVDTDRLRDYWVRGPGAAKIGWGTPGDFNRCRLQVAKYVKPQYLNGYCANRHYDALGFWPGRPVAGDTYEFADLENTEEGPSISLVASASYPKPPKSWFEDPKLEKPTALTITDEGRIFGHLAAWGTCHIGFGKVCMEAPHSVMNYAYFRTGEVLTDGGPVAIGNISIGGGHAAQHLRARPAAAHYDQTSVAVADIAVGEDDHGIWFAGWIKPGIKDDVIAQLRASGGLSGDWREVAGNLELVAALAVNVPGFPVPRVAAAVSEGRQVSLVAAGFVEPEKNIEFHVEAIAEAVAVHLDKIAKRRERMAALAVRVNGD